MLLVGAGLLVRSFVRLQHVSPGFDPERRDLDARRAERAAVRRTATRRSRSTAAGRRARARAWRDGARRGVVAAVHLVGRMGRDQRRRLDAAAGTGAAGRSARRHADYFRTMGIPLLQGTGLHRRRHAGERASRWSIIDEKFAQRFWPAGDAIGKHVWNDPAQQDDDRRRRRHGEAVRPRRRRPHGRVPPERRGARLPGRADGVGDPGRGRARHGPQDSRHRSDDHRCSTSRRCRSGCRRRWRVSGSRRSCSARSPSSR